LLNGFRPSELVAGVVRSARPGKGRPVSIDAGPSPTLSTSPGECPVGILAISSTFTILAPTVLAAGIFAAPELPARVSMAFKLPARISMAFKFAVLTTPKLPARIPALKFPTVFTTTVLTLWATIALIAHAMSRCVQR
jgi:hypothetical protein